MSFLCKLLWHFKLLYHNATPLSPHTHTHTHTNRNIDKENENKREIRKFFCTFRCFVVSVAVGLCKRNTLPARTLISLLPHTDCTIHRKKSKAAEEEEQKKNIIIVQWEFLCQCHSWNFFLEQQTKRRSKGRRTYGSCHAMPCRYYLCYCLCCRFGTALITHPSRWCYGRRFSLGSIFSKYLQY